MTLVHIDRSFFATFDVRLFTETWLTSPHFENSPHFQNYVYYGIVGTHGRGGGVAAYGNKPESHELISDLSSLDANVECPTARVETIVIVTIYRPPAGCKQVFLEFLDNVLQFLSSSSLTFVVMGDIKINMLLNDPSLRQFTDLVNSYVLLKTHY